MRGDGKYGVGVVFTVTEAHYAALCELQRSETPHLAALERAYYLQCIAPAVFPELRLEITESEWSGECHVKPLHLYRVAVSTPRGGFYDDIWAANTDEAMENAEARYNPEKSTDVTITVKRISGLEAVVPKYR